jgi:hypothetical protein
MRPQTEIPAVQVAAIRRALLAVPNKSRFQRLQCLMNKTERVDAPQQANPPAKAQREGIRENQPDFG